MIVEFFPHQPHCYAFGGFEIQMLDAARALTDSGVDIIYSDLWEKLRKAEIVHHWGTGYAHYDNMCWAKKSGQKIVQTTLTSYYETQKESVRGFIGRLISEGRISKKCYDMADAVVVVNAGQADALNRIYGIRFRKIHVIPNIVPEQFYQAVLLRKGYWVCSGNICQRKNQVRIARAAILAQVKLVIIGKKIEGETAYTDELIEIVKNSRGLIRLIPGMPRESDDYIRILSESDGLILASYQEQQPIIALEMLVMRKKIILSNRQYAKEFPFIDAVLVNHACEKSIAEGILTATKMDSNRDVNYNAYTSRAVGGAYRELYSNIY
jgi:glycosyltransferase involved in cell wall biosynthesis